MGVSRKMKSGRRYAQYGCSARHHKGPAVCGNGLTVGEARLLQSVLDKLREYFASPQYLEWMENAYAVNARARARAAQTNDELARLRSAVDAAEARVDRVTESLAHIGFSEPLAAKLKAEEARPLDARQALARASTPQSPAPSPRAFSPAAVLAVVENIGAAALAKPQKAKALLAAIVDAILMRPTPDGYAVEILLKNTNPAALEGNGVGDYQKSCGGRI